MAYEVDRKGLEAAVRKIGKPVEYRELRGRLQEAGRDAEAARQEAGRELLGDEVLGKLLVEVPEPESDPGLFGGPGGEFEALEMPEVPEAVRVTGEVGKGRRLTVRERYEWVFENMDRADLKPEDAPSAGTWSMLARVRANKNLQADFYRTMAAKVMAEGDAGRAGAEEGWEEDIAELTRFSDEVFAMWRETAEAADPCPVCGRAKVGESDE